MKVVELKHTLKEKIQKDITETLLGKDLFLFRKTYLTKSLERLDKCETLGDIVEFLQNHLYYRINDVLTFIILSVIEDSDNLTLEDLNKFPMTWEGC